jgi:hypothetical protein
VVSVEWIIALIVAGLGVAFLAAWLLGFGSSRRAGPARAGAVEAGERTGDWLAELGDWLRRGR